MKTMMIAAVVMVLVSVVSAHVSIFPTTAVVGQRTYVYAQIPHSCEGAPNSIGISVRMPTNITAQPMEKDGWTLTQTTRVKSNGATQADWYTWRANGSGFPDWQLGVFPISVVFPAAYFTPGRRVWFQTIQYCDGVGSQAQSNWTLVTSATAADDLDMSLAVLGETAPSVTVTADASTIIYVNTTQYGVIDNSEEWSNDSIMAVIALILAVLGWLAFILYACCGRSTAAPTASSIAKAPAAQPTTFVSASPA